MEQMFSICFLAIISKHSLSNTEIRKCPTETILLSFNTDKNVVVTVAAPSKIRNVSAAHRFESSLQGGNIAFSVLYCVIMDIALG
jgi:hypothetical protein